MTASLVEQARQGDEEAIAYLLNHALQSQNHCAAVTFKDGDLTLALEGKPAPIQHIVLPLLQRGLLKLQIVGLRTVTVAAREIGESSPVWTANFAGTQRGLLKRLAEYGDAGAIAHLLTQVLAHKQITTRAQLTNDHLTLTLESDPVPDRYTAMTLLKRELASWQTHLIHQVTIQGQGPNATEPLWCDQMTPQAAPPPRRTMAVPTASQKTMKPPPAMWTFKFDYPKLALIGFLMFYGLFSAHQYNFSDFVNGTNPLMMFIHGVNLIFHEAGHTIFSMFGQLIMLLAGSFFQIAVPAFISGYFFFTRQPFAAAVALCWVGENFWDVSIYIKDAQERALPLLGGEGVLHDWHFILVQLWMLDKDDAIGNMAYGIGTVLYAFAIFLGIFYAQIQPSNKTQSQEPYL